LGPRDAAGGSIPRFAGRPEPEHYLVLSRDQRLVHVHSRPGDIWRERFVSAGALELEDPPLRLEVDALYAATEVAA
jgi:hypothetical protein